jgi:urease accessory protein
MSTSIELSWLPALLQTADPLFPTGAYAHSLGFEEMVRLGVIRNEATLGEYLRLHVVPVLRAQELPYLRFAYEAAQAGDLEGLAELDHELSAQKPAREMREASVQIGRRRLAALRAISGETSLIAYADSITRGEALGHHVVVSAVQAVSEGLPLGAALAAWFYQALAGICAAALKLIRIGQDGIQRALRAGIALAAPAISASLHVLREDAGWFSPLLDIASMRHAHAGERLFIS